MLTYIIRIKKTLSKGLPSTKRLAQFIELKWGYLNFLSPSYLWGILYIYKCDAIAVIFPFFLFPDAIRVRNYKPLLEETLRKTKHEIFPRAVHKYNLSTFVLSTGT